MKNYRVNGFEQIKAFYSWVFNNPDKIRPTHISLYLFLLNQANRSNWVEWFKCPYDLAMQGACIGNNGTYYRCLDDLMSWNLIKYQKGINNYKSPLVSLVQLYNSEQVTVPLSEQVTEQLSEQVTEQLSEQVTEQLPVHIYKLITNNIKPITQNLERWLIELKKENELKPEFQNPNNDFAAPDFSSDDFGKNDFEFLIIDILKFWNLENVTEKRKSVTKFIKSLQLNNTLNDFIQNWWPYYKKYHLLSEKQEYKHDIDNFINGKWCAKNWKVELEKLKPESEQRKPIVRTGKSGDPIKDMLDGKI